MEGHLAKKKGKLPVSHRSTAPALLRFRPGAVRRSWPYRAYPTANIGIPPREENAGSGRDRQLALVQLDSVFQPVVQGITDQRLADGDFQQAREVMVQVGQVLPVQVMAGIDA